MVNKENLAFLQDKLKYLGFGEGSPLNQDLTEKVGKGDISFQLHTAVSYGDDTMVEAKLYFLLGNESRYYLQKYDAKLSYDSCPEKNKSQTFFIFKGKGFTLKEAFNLLEGRSVYRKLNDANGVEFQGWSQLNFSLKDPAGNYRYFRYGDLYNYNLDKALNIYPILNLQNDDTKEYLVRSLQRGNSHPVYLVKNDKRAKCLIAANPESRMITIHPIGGSAKTIKEILSEIRKEMPFEMPEFKEVLPGDDEQEDDSLETEVIGAPVDDPAGETVFATAPPKTQRKRIYK
ncbi:MAG: hypothetical protein JST68_10075 [Bacteroidetes bacterium]|nr:hypothetical protein [Bacteroidota bacterium]